MPLYIWNALYHGITMRQICRSAIEDMIANDMVTLSQHVLFLNRNKSSVMHLVLLLRGCCRMARTCCCRVDSGDYSILESTHSIKILRYNIISQNQIKILIYESPFWPFIQVDCIIAIVNYYHVRSRSV